MRLLFVTPEYLPESGGGIITFYRYILPELVRQGHEVEVVVAAARRVSQPEGVIDGVKVRSVESAVHGRWLDRFARYTVIFPWLQEQLALAWAAWETARAGEGYDHVETTDWPLMFVPWVLHRDRVPCTVQLHGSHGQIALAEDPEKTSFADSWVRLIEGALLKEAPSLQTNSQLNAQLWTQRLGRPVAVESPAFQLGSEILPRQATLARPLRGCVFGRLNVGKGAFALAETLAGELGNRLTVEWFGSDAGIGGNPVTNILRARFPGVVDRALRPHPPISHDEVLRKMTNGAFVLIPTLSDVFNLTLAEAMAMRALVVCSQHAGASELIEDGVNGYRYDPLEPGSLAWVIGQLEALTPAQVETMAENGARTVTEKLDTKTNVERRVEFYTRIASLPKSPPVSDWLAEALSASPLGNTPAELLDRCGFSELTTAILRRVPGLRAKPRNG